MDIYRMMSGLGLFALIFIAYLFSNNRKAIQWKVVIWGVVLQFGFGVLILKTTWGKACFESVNDLVLKLMSFQQQGAELVFNALAIPPNQDDSLGFFFAFQVLTTIIFFSALISLLYHFGVMQWVIEGISWVMRRFLRTSGAETLSASANVFLGQTEAPLLIRPFLKSMTQSELLCVMVCGMATVAGGIIAVYVAMFNGTFPDIAGHLLAASLMSAPAGIAISKILIPETETPETLEAVHATSEKKDSNLFEAISSGAGIGLQMALNIGAMLIAFMGLLALGNALLSWGGSLVGLGEITIEQILGYICAPLAFIMGAPWEECSTIGQIIGEKTVINELVAFFHFSDIVKTAPETLSHRSMVILVYSLAGFSNLMSIGIQIGGLGAIVPERKSDLAKLGVRALLGGSLACFMTATIAGMLVS